MSLRYKLAFIRKIDDNYLVPSINGRTLQTESFGLKEYGWTMGIQFIKKTVNPQLA